MLGGVSVPRLVLYCIWFNANGHLVCLPVCRSFQEGFADPSILLSAHEGAIVQLQRKGMFKVDEVMWREANTGKFPEPRYRRKRSSGSSSGKSSSSSSIDVDIKNSGEGRSSSSSGMGKGGGGGMATRSKSEWADVGVRGNDQMVSGLSSGLGIDARGTADSEAGSQGSEAAAAAAGEAAGLEMREVEVQWPAVGSAWPDKGLIADVWDVPRLVLVAVPDGHVPWNPKRKGKAGEE